MKTTICLLALGLAAVPGHAQLFAPSTVGGAVFGAIAGGVIGNNAGSGNKGTEGAVIGALAGGVLGSAYAQSRREPAPYDYTSGGSSYYYAGGPSYYYTSSPYYAPADYYYTPVAARPSLTATTTLLGGVAGAIIGHNNGRRAWQGAAIGAGSGYVLGRLTEPRAHRYRVVPGYVPYPYYRQPVRAVARVPVQTRQITIINNYYRDTSTPMSAANAMFGR